MNYYPTDEWLKKEKLRYERELKNLYPWWVELLIRIFAL
jgi:hypothetical protein